MDYDILKSKKIVGEVNKVKGKQSGIEEQSFNISTYLKIDL